MATYYGTDDDDTLPPANADQTVSNTIYGGGGDDTIQGGTQNDTLYGEDGYDDLSGSSGNDRLYGGKDGDHLDGGGGNDTLDGGAGADEMIGNFGNDIYYVDNIGDIVTEYTASDGFDRVYSSISYTLTDYVENLTLTGIANTSATGNIGNNVLSGNSGDNHLTGGGGRDTLTGGTGADTFVFKNLGDSSVAAPGRDIIVDFSHAQGDHIDLHLIDANTTAGGNQAFTFIGAGSFTHHAGELRAVVTGNNTSVYADVDGNGAADFAITLHGAPVLQSGDFIL